MSCMRPIDRTRWRLCLLLALCCSFYAVGASTALAFPLDTDLSTAQAQLPEGHPCKAPGSIAVLWTPVLIVEKTHVSGQASGLRDDNGIWTLERCEITIDSGMWGWYDECQRRRLVIHEVGHLAMLRHTLMGIMSPDPEVRKNVVVPGCPLVLEPLRDRITAAVLDRVPRGWEVSCGPRRGRVLRCTADHGRRSRAYRARLSDQTGTTFTIVRVKTQ